MGDITIINYGMGNIRSISNMLNWLNLSSIVTDQPEKILKATKLILPGVGAFDSAVNNLKQYKLWEAIQHTVIIKQIPILGICLGMQLMTNKSEEGEEAGFGWINGETKKFKANKQFRVPHMGWNNVYPLKPSNYFVNFHDECKFYFVHSYYVECHQQQDQMAVSNYGISFTSAFQKDNILGVQFHPEKSHSYGMAFLKHFAECF